MMSERKGRKVGECGSEIDLGLVGARLLLLARLILGCELAQLRGDTDGFAPVIVSHCEAKSFVLPGDTHRPSVPPRSQIAGSQLTCRNVFVLPRSTSHYKARVHCR